MLQRLKSLLGRSSSLRQSVSRVDQVAPWLFIGPALTTAEYAVLRRDGITHILDLREEGSDDEDALAELGLRWLRFPIPDRAAPSHEQLAALIEWLEADADPEADQALYIHCHAGYGRTPSMAMALLMQRDLSLAEAHRIVRAARPEVAPTSAQLAWLEEVATRLSR